MSTTTPITRRALREQAVAVEPPRAPRRRIGSILSEAFLWVAALAGIVCLVLVLLAYTMNITLIMFRTGSMSPTIPAGSVAVVQRVPASGISVGDVVTVDRENQLPVTHRVTSISEGQTDESRIITMRGDANEADDPFPYEVVSVRTVLFSVPGVAPFVVALGNPLVLGGLTIGASLLVGWAFWPREPRAKKTAGARGAT